MKRSYFGWICALICLSGCATNIGLNLWEAPGRVPSKDFFLLSPSSVNDEKAFGPQKVFLADMHGEIRKEWVVKRVPGHSRLREDGALLSLLLAGGGPRLTSNGGEYNELIGTSADGREFFSLSMPGLSHDFVPIGLDKIALLKFESMTASEVKKFYPTTQKEFAYSDRISLVDYQGKEEWGWSIKDHIGDLDVGTLNERNMTVSTANSIQFVVSNPISHKPAYLVSFRNLDLILLIEFPTGRVLWRSPKNQLSRQHDATLYGDRVLVFNNNLLRSEVPILQIIEWNILTNQRTFFWEPSSWTAQTPSVMGGVRKLSSGSFLVSNSIVGNLFEVDPKSRRVVWSHLVIPKDSGTRIWNLGVGFYRAEVYSQGEIERMHLISSSLQ